MQMSAAATHTARARFRRRGDDSSRRYAAAIALNRFGLGVRADEPLPGDAKGWLLAQFDRYVAQPPDWSAQPSSAALLVAYGDLLRAQRQADAASEVAARQKLAAEVRDRYRAAVAARVTTALVTPAPFAERLVHFWANHFAVSIEKPSLGSIAGAFEAEAIRPNVFGSFETLLVAVERHPAMLIYLDQVRSIGPESVAARRAAAADPERKRGLNENLAREILELHTTGVRSGYSQDDVTELARALTGWSVGGAAGPYSTRPGIEPGRFVFVRRCTSRAHAMSSVSATKLPAKGRRSPSCAGSQSRRRRRATSRPSWRATSPAMRRRRRSSIGWRPPSRAAAATCRRVYRALIDSPEAWQPAPAKFKTPWEWTLSTLARPRLARPARPGGRADAGAARPADVAAGLAGGLRRHRGELGRARRADAPRRAGAALRRARRQHASTRACSPRSCCPAACRRRPQPRSLAPTARRPRSRWCSRRPNS